MKIAVIGTGISGMLAARMLAADHEVHVFEAKLSATCRPDPDYSAWELAALTPGGGCC